MASSNNFVVKDTATFTWTINNFLGLTAETNSPTFTAPNSNEKFLLRLNPTNTLNGINHVFISLYYYQNQTDLLMQYRFSILDANAERKYTREYRWDYSKSNYSYSNWNVTNYISRDKCNQLVVNGSLKIYCEVDILLKEPVKKLQLQQFESYDKTSDEYQSLYESGKLSDFTVVVGEKEFKVHKLILATHSVVFAAMFEHKKSKEVQEGRVVIADVDVDVFELLLRYIYTSKIPQMDDCASELLAASDKYQLDHLKHICEQTLISTFATESVSGVLLLADMHNAAQLKSKCIEYMIVNLEEVMQSEAWNKLVQTNRIDLIIDLLKIASTKSK